MTEFNHKQTIAMQSLADAAEAVLDAASDGLPPALRENLAQALGRTRGQLPPHLFYESVEQAPIAISITDPDANMLYVNPAFERITGYGRSEVVGCNESLLSDKCTPVHVYQKLWQTLLAQQVWSGTLVNRRKNGERYLAELTIAPVLDRGGVTRHYLAIHHDVSELHRLERQARNQKQRIETTVDLAPMAIALLDENGQVVRDNLAYKTLCAGLGEEPGWVSLAQQEWRHAEGEGIAFMDREVYVAPRDDRAERWFSCSGTWVLEMDDRADAFFVTESRRYLLLVIQEITRLKQQEQEVRNSALRALIAEGALVQGLREAVAAAEFQLQGPFNMLKAALGLLERRAGDENNGVVDVVRQALASGQQALEALRGAMPREQPDVPTRLNVNQSLRDVLSLMTERMLALGVQIDWQPAPRLPPVIGSENRLRVMFKQLVDNALDAMNTPQVQERELRLSTAADGAMVRVVIEDSGTGIPDDLRLKVFEPFFTTKGTTRHAGMGLSMVREVVNQHHGTLWLERSEAGGCRVQLQLPAQDGLRLAGDMP